MKTHCERCQKFLPVYSEEARICSYECTYCETCATQNLGNKCPKCDGDLVPRPVRKHAKELKSILSLVVLLISMNVPGIGQIHLPIIEATNNQAYLVEDGIDTLEWNLNPDVKPDIYYVTKTPHTRTVSLYTDLDSISFKMKPGLTIDFIVLLNKQDTCYTRFVCRELKHLSSEHLIEHDTIPFELTEQNSLRIKSILDEKDTLWMNFDSGSTQFRLTSDAIKKLNLDVHASHHIRLGGTLYEREKIIEVTLSGHGTDGRFGWDLFDGKVVEIDYDKKLFIVHTHLERIPEGYAKLPIYYRGNMITIQGGITVNEKTISDDFLVDNGYQRSIMLDHDLVKEKHVPIEKLSELNRTFLRNSDGDTVRVVTYKGEAVQLNALKITNVPLQLMAGENPSGMKLHIVGNDLLKRFNTIMDFQNNFVYFKPNRLFKLPFMN